MNKIFAGLLFFGLFFVLNFSIATAAAQSENAQIPEKNGDYADPIHPGVRVRVFVYQPGKPEAQPALVCEDPNSNSVIPATGWYLPSTVTYRLNTSSVPSSVGSASLSTIASSAFNQWMNADPGKVAFTQGADTTVNRQALDFQNIIAWGRTSGSALAVTYTRYYTATHEVADVDTIMNKKFAWRWNGGDALNCPDNNAYDAQNILTHELGHWMGLNDTYTAEFVNNTMYGYGSKNEVKKDTLTTGDVNGVQAIY